MNKKNQFTISKIWLFSLGLLTFLLIVTTSYLLTSRWLNKSTSIVVNGSDYGHAYYSTGSDYLGNYVYGAATQLAVNELNTNILKDKLRLKLGLDIKAQKKLDLFDLSEFTTNDLDSQSYYVKSGYGQKTVDLVNLESRQKFPDKSFKDLELSLRDKEFLSYAYLLKKMQYPVPFSQADVYFNQEKVRGFKLTNGTQVQNLEIISYSSDNKFFLKLLSKDGQDEIFLAKGYSPSQTASLIALMNKPNPKYVPFNEGDVFEVPEIHLKLSRDYNEFIDKFLLNPGFLNYKIAVMRENLKFDFDYQGARVENEGYIVNIVKSSLFPTLEPKIKIFKLDKPFLLMMKRTNSQLPYFILGVNNTNLMQKSVK